MAQDVRVERLEPYLRPSQVSDMLEEKRGIEATLRSPAFIQERIHDKGAMLRHVRNIDKTLYEHTAKPYAESEIDTAVRREAELRERITHGMPTQEEMRRNPAGAVDKHRNWELAMKPDILEWKNLRIRLHASGMIDDHPDAREVANLERYRPSGGAQQLNLHNAQITGKSFSFPNGPIEIRNVMSDEEKAALAKRDASLATKK